MSTQNRTRTCNLICEKLKEEKLPAQFHLSQNYPNPSTTIQSSLPEKADVTTGAYFYRIKAGELVDSGKMLLLK